MSLAHVMTQKDWEPFGVRCMDCDVRIVPGDLFVNRPLGMVHDTPAVETVCITCGGGD